MGHYLTILASNIIVNNFVLTRFLGLCIFFGVSKSLNASIGIGMAVTSVMTLEFYDGMVGLSFCITTV